MENVKRVLPVGTVTGVTSALFHLSESCCPADILEYWKGINRRMSLFHRQENYHLARLLVRVFKICHHF